MPIGPINPGGGGGGLFVGNLLTEAGATIPWTSSSDLVSPGAIQVGYGTSATAPSGPTSIIATLEKATTPGSTIAVVVFIDSTSTDNFSDITVTDTGSNAYTLSNAQNVDTTNSVLCAVYYCHNAAAASAITLASSRVEAAINLSAVVYELTGMGAVDTYASGYAASGTAATASLAAVPAQFNEFAVGAICAVAVSGKLIAPCFSGIDSSWIRDPMLTNADGNFIQPIRSRSLVLATGTLAATISASSYWHVVLLTFLLV